MGKPGSILVATDFSRDAALAASRAVALAGELGVDDVQMLHVVDAPWFGTLQQWFGLAESTRQGLVDGAEHSMAGLVSAIEAETGCRVASSVVVGNLLKAVVERAARAGLLVVGARGEHPVRDFAIGTTGERLIRKRRGAMLVARCQPVSSYRRVLAPVDFSKHSAPVVRQAIAIAPTAQIVIGKHGQSIVEDLLLGSVTLHVLGEARCDVLVVSAAQP